MEKVINRFKIKKIKIFSLVLCLFCLFEQNILAQNTDVKKQYQVDNALYSLLDNGTVSLDGFTTQPTGVYRIPSAIVIDGKEHTVSLLKQKSFLNSRELTSVIIPAGVDSVGYGLFGNCSKLMEIIVNQDNAAFKSEDGVLYSKDGTKLYFYPINKSQYQKGRFVTNENVKEIANYAFVNNWYKQIVLSEVEKIGEGAFFQCMELNYVFISNSVVYIGDFAFDRCRKLEYVNFQEESKIESINSYTFSGCNKLNSFDNFPKNLKSIGAFAFSECESFTSFELPESITCIGSFAFNACKELNTINIPDGIEKIEKGAFKKCYRLSPIILPESVKIIGDDAFNNCQSIKTIDLPESLEVIGKNAFFHCSNLISVIIPNRVTQIGDGAFSECPELELVTLPDQLESIDSNTFAYCSKLKSIELPPTLQTMGDYVFRETGLESIIIPENLISYGKHFLTNCNDLTSITFLNDRQDLPDSVFYNLKKLKNVKLSDDLLIIGDSAFRSSGITHIEIPQYVIIINSNAFASCSNLRSVKLNQNLLFINKGAFSFCQQLEDIDLPENLMSIGEQAFSHCDSLKSVTIPVYITKIERETFRDCGELAEINFHANIDSIMPYAFEGCGYSLKKVILPENLTYLGENAFAYCYELTYIKIPESLTKIPANAFSEDFRLNYINIPATVTEIGKSAFECTSAFLFDVYMHSYEPPAIYDSNVFLNETFPHRAIYIPKGSKKAYKADPNWKKLNLKEIAESKMPE